MGVVASLENAVPLVEPPRGELLVDAESPENAKSPADAESPERDALPNARKPASQSRTPRAATNPFGKEKLHEPSKDFRNDLFVNSMEKSSRRRALLEPRVKFSVEQS